MSTTLTLDELYRPVQEPLNEVRRIMDGLWTDALSLVGFEHDLKPKAGGKLLRPALCLMAAGAIGARDLGRYPKLAASFEALHIASLTHDDVIDRALLRRGQTSLSGMWDNHAAVLGGDYLVARAVEMLAEYDHCPVIANAIRSVRCMAEGELFFFNRDVDTVTPDDCIMLAKQKTASLFAEACSAPAHILGGDHHSDLYDFGEQLGIAFQLVDDILDITQPTDKLGKPACGDVAEGKRTIPIMYLREALPPKERQQLHAMENRELSDADRDWVIARTHESGARERAEALTDAYADGAREALRRLPESEYRNAMEGIVEFVLVRGA